MRGTHGNTGLKGKTPSAREAQDGKCCCERMRVGGKALCSQNRRDGRARERDSPGQAAGLSHFLEELEEVIAIGVCNTSRQHRGRKQGGWESIGCPEPNPADVSTAHPGPPPNVPQSHTTLEVLNTTLYTSPKWGHPGLTGHLRGHVGASMDRGRLSSPTPGGTVCSETEMV